MDDFTILLFHPGREGRSSTLKFIAFITPSLFSPTNIYPEHVSPACKQYLELPKAHHHIPALLQIKPLILPSRSNPLIAACPTPSLPSAIMAQYYPQPPQQGYNPSNLQFYPSTYPQPVSGHTTPSQAHYYGQQSPGSNQAYGGASGFGAAPTFGPGVSGRMGEQGGLRTGWLAAFGTDGYDGEPPLLEELGVNFGHIKGKVSLMGYLIEHPVLSPIRKGAC